MPNSAPPDSVPGAQDDLHRDPRIEDFLISHGGPFYELQRRLNLLHDRALRAGTRATLFVCLTWGVPFLLSIISGHAFGSFSDNPFVLNLGVWARLFVAVGLLVFMERQVEERLSTKLAQFVRAPLVAPESMTAFGAAVNHALKQRDSKITELICLGIAVAATVASLFNILGAETSSWAVTVSGSERSLTLPAYWCLFVSSPIFWFLLVRALWRHFVWTMVLRKVAALKLRLVATHPDGMGGLAFVGQYPNAYTILIFAISCVLGAALANELTHDRLSTTVYGSVMSAWLVIVLALFAYPLSAFSKPLTELKERTLLLSGAQATRFHRLNERKVMGANVSAPDAGEAKTDSEVMDPTGLFDKTRKLSVFLLSRSALLPVCAAALLPLAAAGITKMPYKEMLTIAKRLLLL